MRIYRRAEFVKLPAGVMYCPGEPWGVGSLHVKGETLPPNDFVCLALNSIDYDSSEQLTERLEEMLEKGYCYPMNDTAGRDGGFRDTEIYLVYELHDLTSIVEHCHEAMVTISKTVAT